MLLYWCWVAMEEWDFVDERALQNWKGGVVCMTCQHFIYGVDQHCHTMVGCNLWAPTWPMPMGWPLR